MKQIEPQKISGLIDGELTPDEAERVRQAIDEDEVLGAEYQELASLDEDLKSFADGVAFQPKVLLLPGLIGFRYSIPLILTAALALRIMLKVLPPVFGCLIATGMLVLVIWGMVRLLKSSTRELVIRESGIAQETVQGR